MMSTKKSLGKKKKKKKDTGKSCFNKKGKEKTKNCYIAHGMING